MSRSIYVLLACFAAALPCVFAADAPATQPAEPTAMGVVRGHVTITGGLGLQKPDLTRVVVFMGSNPVLDAQPDPTTRATCSQYHKAFVPDFLIISRGTDVEFPNWDHIDHNVFSRSAAAPAFDLDRYPYGQSKTRTFDKLGVVQVFCNIHPQMRAIIYVAPNRFFTRPDANGDFQISGLPAGTFDVNVWQDRCEPQRQSVQVSLNSPVQVSFTLGESHDRIVTSSSDDRPTSYGVERGLGVKREPLNLPVVGGAHPAPQDSQP